MHTFTKRFVLAVLLAAILVVTAVGVFRAHGAIDAGPDSSVGYVGRDPVGATSMPACTDSVTIEASVIGSFTESVLSPHQFEWINEPSLVLVTSRAHVKRVPPSMVVVGLAEPFFSAEFAAQELCSTEEASPSRLRVLCLGEAARLTSIEVRVEHQGRDLVIKVDEVDGKPLTPELPGLCMTLKTQIPKRDITRLQRAFLDDSVSERCSINTGRQQIIAATFDRIRLPAGHELASKAVCPRSSLCCNDNNTFVRLLLPIESGSVQDLGILSNQCGGCVAKRYPKLNGIRVDCADESISRRFAFQLGDYLYYAESDRVRRAPLPCGVKLQFRFHTGGTLRPIEEIPLE